MYTHHGRQSDVVSASLIPHSNLQLEWEYLWGKQLVLKNRLRNTLNGNWVSLPPMQSDNPFLMEQGFPFAEGLYEIHIHHIHEPNLNMMTLRVAYPLISMWKDFCLWWCGFQKPSHCASFQQRDWCGQPKVKIINIYNTPKKKPVREENLQFVQEAVWIQHPQWTQTHRSPWR